MQSGVLWEEPELAVDSERSLSSGNGVPVDTICPIILISIGLTPVPTSGLGGVNTPKQHKPISTWSVYVSKFDGVGVQTRSLEKHWNHFWDNHLKTQAPGTSSKRQEPETSRRGEQTLRVCVFYCCLNSSKLQCRTVKACGQSLRRSCFSQAFVVCMCVPAHSDPPHGWLVGIPAPLCNYVSPPGLSDLLSLHSHTLTRQDLPLSRGAHFTPGHLAHTLILTHITEPKYALVTAASKMGKKQLPLNFVSWITATSSPRVEAETMSNWSEIE